MFCEPLGDAHVAVAEGFLSRCQSFTPGAVWLVLSGVYGYEIPDWPSKYTHSRRQQGVTVWSVAVLEHGSLECICVEGTVNVGVVCEKSFDALDSYFCAAVAVRECDR